MPALFFYPKAAAEMQVPKFVELYPETHIEFYVI